MRVHHLSCVRRGVLLALLLLSAAGADASAATRVWTGAAGDNLLMTAGNWQGSQAPNPGDDLVFGLVVPSTIVLTNNFPDGTIFASITFDTDKYIIIGNRLALTAFVTLTAGGAVSIGAPVILAPPAASPVIRLIAAHPIASLHLGGVVAGPPSATLQMEGPGSVSLTSGGNSYEGPTHIVSGQLVANTTHVLGSPAAGTWIHDGASLFIGTTSFISVEEPLTLAGQGRPGMPGDGALYLDSSLNGEIVIDAPITLTGSGPVLIVTNGSDPVAPRITQPITGSVELILNTGDGLDLLMPAPNGVGAVTMTRGRLTLRSTGQPVFAHGLTLGDGVPVTASISLGLAAQITGGLTLASDGVARLTEHPLTVDTLKGSGRVELDDSTLTIVSPAASDTTFSGLIVKDGQVVKAGPGTWRIDGTQTYTGSTSLQLGTLIVNGAAPAPLAQSGGTLRGGGMVGAVTSGGGMIAPGDEINLGVLKTGALTLGAASTVSLRVRPSPLANDQIDVTGSVTLGGAALQVLAASASFPQGAPFVLIKNDGTDPVSGTFAGLPDGATFVAGGKVFSIDYTGGTGNDVVITLVGLEYYLSEGATGGWFDYDLLLLNPHPGAAPVTIRFYPENGVSIARTLTLPGLSRETIRVDDIAGLEGTAVSVSVTSTSGVPLVVERTMRWNASGYGGHAEKAVPATAPVWYFAEGSQGFFQTYLLLLNPHDTPNTATIEYLREGTTPLVRTYPLLPHARTTIDASLDPQLVNRSFGAIVTFAQPGVAERAMYFGTDPFWSAGSANAGVTQPSTDWYLAEGATGPFFETFVLIANPNATDTTATITFYPGSDAPVQRTRTIPARGRVTLNLEAEDAALANAAIATRVTSAQPVVVERVQYWPGTPATWHESHSSAASAELAHAWGLADGRVGGPDGYQTYILLANPGDTATTVTLTFVRESGPPLMKQVDVGAQSRVNLSVGPGTLVPELVDERFGVIVSSQQAPIAVERAMYWNADGQVWAAGTNVTGTRLP